MKTKPASEPVFDPRNYFAADGEKGMTSTAANKMANLAKERNREDMLMLENIKFYNNMMTLLVKPTEKVLLSQGLNGGKEEFANIREALMRVARFNAFIAWVREAIAARETMLFETRHTSLEQWCEQQGIECPEMPVDDIDDDLYKSRAAATATIDDMARYFVNQAKAAALGQAVHPDGAIDRARRELIDASLNPAHKEGTGQETVIITKQPTAETKEVTDFYMSLQSNWRHAEAAVNQAKSNWNSQDALRRIALTNEFNAKKRQYDSEMLKLRSQYDEWRLQESIRIGKLKIRVPAALQLVLDELLSLGRDHAE